MTYYSIGKSLSGKYTVVSSFYHVNRANKRLPNIAIFVSPIGTETIYYQSSLFCNLVKSELFMDKLPNVPTENMVAFNWLYHNSYMWALNMMCLKMPPDFQLLYDALMAETHKP